MQVTHVERSSGDVRLGWCANGTAAAVTEVIGARLCRLSDRVLSLACDRGSQFAHDTDIARALSRSVYLADPHAPWQRGCNEHLNGVLRQYFPRSRDFSTITPEEVQHALCRMDGCTAADALEGVTRQMKTPPASMRTSLTYDRGTELTRYAELMEG
ncbi:IS30 family transposase [Xanthomonas populi]